MANSLGTLIKSLIPENTILFFGAGSSIPSGAPSVERLKSVLKARFSIDGDYSLTELTGLIEITEDRLSLIKCLRSLFTNVTPTQGLLNLPLYSWKSIFTTNYDNLIEQSFSKAGKDLKVIASSFDFSNTSNSYTQTKLFKVHGTIEQDIVDGKNSRIIITDQDYDHTDDYRQQLWKRFEADIGESHLLIIGYSLSDRHIKDMIDRAISYNTGSSKISLILYSEDENRAKLYEKRGIKVYFGSIDDFFFALSNHRDAVHIVPDTEDLLAVCPELRPITTSVKHSLTKEPNFSAMFNGWSATYSDISNDFTFDRTVSENIISDINNPHRFAFILLGAGGVGKTTLARQTLFKLNGLDYLCWEHQPDHPLLYESWLKIAKELGQRGLRGVLFIDEAHSCLFELNNLTDKLALENQNSLKLIIVSSRNLWEPRIKSPNIYKYGHEYKLSRLDNAEIDSLIFLIEHNSQIRQLAEKSFSGFSRSEKRRRLLDRCDSDMFVCLKNIFASEKFDDIILREYAQLHNDLQEVYKIVAAMEFSGIKVHRQLIIRLLNINAPTINALLQQLSEIIVEYPVDEREGIYGWKSRHTVIAGIIAKYKYGSPENFIDLFRRVLDNISPTYEIEVRTIRELCNIDTGVPSIPEKDIQNEILRQMISIAPGEKIPRHRLIRNLIDSEDFEKAEIEIRIFENDFGAKDGTVLRYKVTLLYSRAMNTKGILSEDRETILEEALVLAKSSINKFPNHKYVLSTYAELGMCYLRLFNQRDIVIEAISLLKIAEPLDPDISHIIAKFERAIARLYQPELN